jgi:hypothetical protein
MAPGKLSENQTPKHATNRVASEKYYKDNASEVQARKLYAGLISGKRKNVSQKTIAKYGIKFNAKGEVIVPEKYKPKAIITVEPQEPRTIVVKGREEVVIEPRVMKTGAVTTFDVQTYIKTDLNTDLEKDGKKVLKKETIAQYSTGAGIFLKLGLVKEYTDDIMPFVKDPTNTLKVINARKVEQSTKNKDFHSVYNMIKNVPMVRDQVGKDILQAYGKELQLGKQALGDKKYSDLDTKKVYVWTDIVDRVESTFGKNSLQYLYMKVFEEVPIRTELANMPLVVTGEEPPKEGNYAIVKGNKKPVEIHLRDYKTKFTYGNQVYTLSKPLTNMIIASLKSEPRSKLFPISVGISNWLNNMLTRSGYANFPYGSETTQSDRDKVYAGMRHTFASYANSPMNKKQFPRSSDLAKLMLHNIAQSATVYQNRGFLTEEDRVGGGEASGSGTVSNRSGGRRKGAKNVKGKGKA